MMASEEGTALSELCLENQFQVMIAIDASQESENALICELFRYLGLLILFF